MYLALLALDLKNELIFQDYAFFIALHLAQFKYKFKIAIYFTLRREHIFAGTSPRVTELANQKNSKRKIKRENVFFTFL